MNLPSIVKVKFVTIFFLVNNLFIFSQYKQLGDKILIPNKIGTKGDLLYLSPCTAVSLSADGKTALVGGYNDNSGEGAAWIYTFNGTNYIQFGEKLIGTGNETKAFQGYSVSLSADGRTALIGGYFDVGGQGAAWVFTFNGTNYVQFGNKLKGKSSIGNAYQGFSVSLSSDAKTAVLGGPYHNDFGAVWVFTFNGNNYVQYDSLLAWPLSGNFNHQGKAVSTSADGKTILISCISGFQNQGAALVYTFNGSNYVNAYSITIGTEHIDNDIDAPAISISADGKTILIEDTEDYSHIGEVYVLTFNGLNYIQIGDPLQGTGFVDDSFQGSSVSLSADGQVAMVGGNLDDGALGAVWVFTFNGTNYVQVGNKLVGTGSPGAPGVFRSIYQGTSISVSADGKTILDYGFNDNNDDQLAIWFFNNDSLPCNVPNARIIATDTNICPSAFATFTSEAYGTGLLLYSWYQDNTLLSSGYSSSFSSSKAGNYFCTVSNSCGSVTSKGINVKYLPKPVLTGSIFPNPVCFGNPVSIMRSNAKVLTISGGFGTVSGTGFIPYNNDTYTLTGIVDGCIATTSTSVVVNEYPMISTPFSKDTLVCSDNGAKLNALNPGANYYWSTGESTSTIIVQSSGNYSVNIKNTCHEQTFTIDVKFSDPKGYFNHTNVFTPNKDGVNESWKPFTEFVNEYKLYVYNRWGSLVFKTEDSSEAWTAADNPDGVYFYAISFSNCQHKKVDLKGIVEVLR